MQRHEGDYGWSNRRVAWLPPRHRFRGCSQRTVAASRAVTGGGGSLFRGRPRAFLPFAGSDKLRAAEGDVTVGAGGGEGGELSLAGRTRRPLREAGAAALAFTLPASDPPAERTPLPPPLPLPLPLPPLPVVLPIGVPRFVGRPSSAASAPSSSSPASSACAPPSPTSSCPSSPPSITSFSSSSPSGLLEVAVAESSACFSCDLQGQRATSQPASQEANKGSQEKEGRVGKQERVARTEHHTCRSNPSN